MKIEIGDLEQDHLYRRETREGRIRVRIDGKWYVVKFAKSVLYDDISGDYENEIEFELPDEIKKDEGKQEEIEEFLTDYFEKEAR